MTHTVRMELTRRAPASALLTVRTEVFVHEIESAAADLRRRGLAVTHQQLAQYTDMPEYLIRKVVELKPAAGGILT